jgi:hypothetical protein
LVGIRTIYTHGFFFLWKPNTGSLSLSLETDSRRVLRSATILKVATASAVGTGHAEEEEAGSRVGGG